MNALVAFLASDQCQGRAPGSIGGLLARHQLIERVDGLGLQPTGSHGFEHPIPSIDGANIVGVIPAARASDRHIVLGAHYDHLGIHFDTIHPGADDNASGVAVALDVSRQLLERRDQLDRNVLVVLFDAEEPPHFYTENMGSVFFIRQPAVPLDSIDLMICLDLVGHALGLPDMPPEVRRSLFVVGAERGPFAQLVDRYSDEGLFLRRCTNAIQPPMSDHYAFQNAGIPSMFFTAGRDRHYHTPEDTAEKLDYQRMAVLADCLVDLIISASRFTKSVHYDADASDDAADLETLVLMGKYAAPHVRRADRALQLLDRMRDKHQTGADLSSSDLSVARRLWEQFEQGLA